VYSSNYGDISLGEGKTLSFSPTTPCHRHRWHQHVWPR